MQRRWCRALFVAIVFGLAGCATAPPEQVDNVCDIFREKTGWYEDAKQSRARWGVPVSISMAFMHQESRFVATAKPPRKKLWGVIPGPRPSDSYGYSQAKQSTWEWYQRSTGNYGADRDDFGDAVDFMAGTTMSLIVSWGLISRMHSSSIWPITRDTGAIAGRLIDRKIGW